PTPAYTVIYTGKLHHERGRYPILLPRSAPEAYSSWRITASTIRISRSMPTGCSRRFFWRHSAVGKFEWYGEPAVGSYYPVASRCEDKMPQAGPLLRVDEDRPFSSPVAT
ncbi:MAG TPA: hypothetical protein VGO22_11330, partial [Pseudorhizobium sp.]|nr:hypothetical protein [Pseudorhizobium sp.]